jgi:hypothetical protein
MADKVNYSIINSVEGNIAVRSTVKSFNLDHVTEKDIVSFYNHFSQYSAWDTGLLPVDGSGMLSLRTAGIYTQFAYQHKPGLYHVNWSKSEGSPATAYYVAQPYRIIICDMKEGNLLGARMFYSPYPITNPSQPLYHVNLPNTNCKGYRNNSVGWQCLYQNEDWSALPLNERIVRFIERCSGVETFNDGNMSETDGTRFYRENNKPEYLWNPVAWQEKSQEGYEWTLDESLWIPVLVKDKDDQKEHYSNGNPLTLADALVGDYRAYYYDDQQTKPINAIIRPDKELSASDVMGYFVSAYSSATAQTTHILNNTFEASQQIKDKKGSAEFTGSSLLSSVGHQSEDNDEDDEEDTFYCESCEDTKHVDDHHTDAYGNSVCNECLHANYVYIPSAQGHYPVEDDDVVYSDYLSEYFHKSYDSVNCCECGELFGVSGLDKDIPYIHSANNSSYCVSCIDTFASDEQLTIRNCHACSAKFIEEYGSINGFKKTFVAVPSYSFDEDNAELQSISNVSAFFCNPCSGKYFICPCGFPKPNNLDAINNNIEHDIELSNSTLKITSCCADCTKVNFDGPELSLEFTPQNPQIKQYHLDLETTGLVSSLHINYNNEEPF